MIKEIYIENFKGIKRCEESIKFTKFNVLIGPNGSGKTSLLEALYFIPPLLQQDTPLGTCKLTFLRERYTTDRWFSYHYSEVARISGIAEDKNFELELDPSLSGLIKMMRVQDATYYAGIQGRIFWTLENLSRKLIPDLSDRLNNYSIYIIPNENLRNYLLKFFLNADMWSLIESKGLHNKVIRELVKYGKISDNFTEIIIRFNEFWIRKELKDGSSFYIRFSDLSDSLKNFILPMLLLYHVNPKVVLWDNFEAYAHPQLLGFVIDWLLNSDWQVILSTHSIDVLYELLLNKNVKEDEVSIIRLQRTEDDILKASIIGLNTLEKYFEAKLDIRKIFE